MNDVELMIHHIEQQNMDEAEQTFQRIKRSGSSEDQYMLAEQLLQYGFLEEARQLFDLLIRTYPDEGELKLSLAEILIEMDREEEAYPYLEAILPADPEYPASLLLQADLYEMQGLLEVAEQKLQLAKRLVQDEPVIDYALGELYMSQGRFLEATRHFKLLLDAGEQTIAGVSLASRMAESLSAGGAFEESLPYYEKAVESHKEINGLFGFALTLYQAGHYQQAVQRFNQLKEMDPEYHSLYLYLAKCYEHLEEIDDALKTVLEGIALDAYHKEMLFYAGTLALKKGLQNEAEDYLRQALALDPEYMEAALTLNKLLLHEEKYEEVVELAATLNLEEAGEPRFHWDLAVSLQQLEKYPEALNEYEQAYNAFKDHRDFLKDYGYFLLEEGLNDKAKTLFQTLSEIEPMNEEWMDLLNRLNH